MKSILIVFLCAAMCSCHSQKKDIRNVGGRCEGCQALEEYGSEKLNTIDTLPGFMENAPQIHLFGTVYLEDGNSPAKDIIIYIYHTNREGIYEVSSNSQGWGKRHGIYRGWVKTDETGKYEFYTFRPASYPNRQAPEHIHMTVKEPLTNPYYIDDIMFTDDPLLTESEINNRLSRGGSGIVIPVKGSDDIQEIRRDITLGLNIPDY